MNCKILANSVISEQAHPGIVEREQIHLNLSRGLRTTEMSFSITWVYRLSHIKFHKARGRGLYCNTPTTDNAVKFNM